VEVIEGVVDGTELWVATGGFDGVGSGREGSADCVFGVVDDQEEPVCAKPTGGGFGGSEG